MPDNIYCSTCFIELGKTKETAICQKKKEIRADGYSLYPEPYCKECVNK